MKKESQLIGKIINKKVLSKEFELFSNSEDYFLFYTNVSPKMKYSNPNRFEDETPSEFFYEIIDENLNEYFGKRGR